MFVEKPISIFKFAGLLLLACICLIADSKYQMFDRFKGLFATPRYYILNLVNYPFSVSKNIMEYFVNHNSLINENRQLHEKLLAQSASLQILNSLEHENARLKNLLNFANFSNKNIFSLANIMEVNLDPFTHQIVIEKGANQGAFIGQTILNADGILGSIIKVEPLFSVGSLITDLNYAIPVLNLRNGLRAIALGTGDPDHLTLQHIPKTADLAIGDLLVTSGLGGKYPSGYLVGKVINIAKEVNFPFATVTLQVAAKLTGYREVLLIERNHKNTK